MARVRIVRVARRPAGQDGGVQGYDEGWRVMGRRTVWWGASRASRVSGVSRAWRAWRVVAAVGATFCVTAALAGQAAAAGTPAPYAFAEDAMTVEGTTSTTGAARLAPGTTYRSSIRQDGKLYYRLELDDTANAYVSATAVPRLGTTVASSEGVKVTIQDADGHRCSSETARFGPTRSPHPVTAWASREIGRDPYMCQGAGTYYVLVERVGTLGSSQGSSQGSQGSPDTEDSPGTETSQDGEADEWGMELGYVLEPGLKKAGPTSAPEVWNSASPEGLTGDAKRRRGGSSFATASAVAQGVWEEADGIQAGQTLYYKVPVDWGQQLYATAELGSASGGDGYVGGALVMSLYNPVRGFVDDVMSSYDGRQKTSNLDPLPPVLYDNRFALDDESSGMRFAGWYYLAVHLGAPVADRFGDKPFGLTLRVRVAGTAKEGPGYLGVAEPQGVFEVTDEDREAAESGSVGRSVGAGGSGTSEASEGSGGDENAEASGGSQGLGSNDAALRLVAVGGLGTGSMLVLGLGVWTVVARRRAAGAVAAEPGEQGGAGAGAAVRGYGPPRGW